MADNRLDVNSQHNVDLIDEFFQKNRQVPVTVANIYRAVEERKNAYIWLSQAEADWYRAAKQSPELANSLAAHLAANGGSPGRLQNQGDALFENLLLLFNELQGRRESASFQTIQNAEDRIAHRPGKQLHRVPTPRRTEPTSRAAQEFDGVNPFSSAGLVRQRDGSFGKSPADYAREAQAREEKASLAAKTTRPVDVWENLCNEFLRFGTHGAQAAMRQIYERGISQRKSFREIYAEMNQLKKSYEHLVPTSKY